MFSSLKQFDSFPKTLDDFKVKTLSGGTVTLISTVLIIILSLSEFARFISPKHETTLTVDPSFDKRLQINIDVTFPHMPCALISVDAMDVSGEQQNDIHHSVFKTRLDAEGKQVGEVEKHDIGGSQQNSTSVDVTSAPGYCGSCYGAETKPGQCCNTCEEVREAYRLRSWAFNPGVEQCAKESMETKLQEQRHEGCRIHGSFNVQRVAGNFHFAPGKSFQHANFHVHDFQSLGDISRYNVSHKINYLSFGRKIDAITNPLDGQYRSAESAGMFQYYVKVVPTTYESDGEIIDTNQFSFTEYYKSAVGQPQGRTLPGVFVIYDISPILVTISNEGKSFLHFITQLCAIVGGIFTVAGMFDTALYRAQKIMAKKGAEGKLG